MTLQLGQGHSVNNLSLELHSLLGDVTLLLTNFNRGDRGVTSPKDLKGVREMVVNNLCV